MYIPEHFNEAEIAALHALVAAHPFGTLVTHTGHGLDANHIPFVLHAEEGARGVLRAHVARANLLWQQLADGDAVLAIFRGPDAYVSPNWYPSKHEQHRQVPTWNYQVVHAHGHVTVHDDEKFVRGVVARLSKTHEATQPVPWKMGDAPRDYLDAMLKAIVGIEIAITRLEGKFKLSQNKEERDVRGAEAGLRAAGEHPLADAMLAAATAKAARAGGR